MPLFLLQMNELYHLITATVETADTGMIVGIVVAVLIFIIILAVVVVVVRRRKNRE